MDLAFWKNAALRLPRAGGRSHGGLMDARAKDRAARDGLDMEKRLA